MEQGRTRGRGSSYERRGRRCEAYWTCLLRPIIYGKPHAKGSTPGRAFNRGWTNPPASKLTGMSVEHAANFNDLS